MKWWYLFYRIYMLQLYQSLLFFLFLILILSDITYITFLRLPLYNKFFFSGQSTKGKGLSTLRKKQLFSNVFFFLVCRRWKIKYILLKTAYPNIDISVLVYYVLCCQSEKSQSLTVFLKYLTKNMFLLLQKL